MKLIVPKKYVVNSTIETNQITLHFPTYSKRIRFTYSALDDYIKLDFATREDKLTTLYIVSDIANNALELCLNKNVETVKVKFVLPNQEINKEEDGVPILPLPFGIRVQKGYYKISEGFVSHVVMRRLLIQYLQNINPLDFMHLAHRIIQVIVG